jgi:hypothetical protein
MTLPGPNMETICELVFLFGGVRTDFFLVWFGLVAWCLDYWKPW